MTTWDDYLGSGEAGEAASEIGEGLRDIADDLERQEWDAILRGDVEAAEVLHDRAAVAEEDADLAESAEQDLQWAQEYAAEADRDADAAAADAALFPETAMKEAYMAEIASEGGEASTAEALASYEQISDDLGADDGLS